jgi:hypothetical protein
MGITFLLLDLYFQELSQSKKGVELDLRFPVAMVAIKVPEQLNFSSDTLLHSGD